MAIWVENSTDPDHGGGDWGYGKALWAPQWNKGGEGKSSAVHTRVGEVKDGDLVIHLREEPNRLPVIDAFSFADGDGELTTERPPKPGGWGGPDIWPSGEQLRYYRANLRGFTEFQTNPAKKITLEDFFDIFQSELREHIDQNSGRGLFYSRKRDDEVQRAQGYLHKADDFVYDLIKKAAALDFADVDFVQDKDLPFLHNKNVSTDEKVRLMAARQGQQKLARLAKAHYGNTCCFPGCDISEVSFLIGSHIVRWSDDERLRGDLKNVLCLCVVHDIGFERGYWWVDQQGNVAVDHSKLDSTTLKGMIGSMACQALTAPDDGDVAPLQDYFDRHRDRIGQ